jgi:hypothetical protein
MGLQATRPNVHSVSSVWSKVRSAIPIRTRFWYDFSTAEMVAGKLFVTGCRSPLLDSGEFLMLRLLSSALLTFALICGQLACSSPLKAQDVKITYPATKTVDQVDEFHGTKVADPYRWLEDDVRRLPESHPAAGNHPSANDGIVEL